MLYNFITIRAISSVICILCSVALSSTLFGQEKYEVFMNLNEVVEDKLKVTLHAPKIKETEIEYHIPKIVPGTYSIYDFGRFISDFKAFDINGTLLEVDSISPNRRLIKESNKLSTITYWVEDTYDTRKDNFVFEPAGTNIQKDENFIINNYGFVGYLQNYKHFPYRLNIKHSPKLFGATGLMKKVESDSVDIFDTSNYFDLADGPIMYCRPDTSAFSLGGAEILVSVYSPNKIAKSELISGYIKETLEAQKDYLKGKLPVDRYTFLIYHYPGIFSGSMALGALEHSYSSLYSLPELHPILNSQYLKDFTAHEFFHIITPLNIHSEEIGDFDFINPQMSKHLWLYEGVTEYAAGLAQVKYGQMDMQRYLEVIQDKIKKSYKYNENLAFTELSQKCLSTHKTQYGNVYQKGALIGLCLDITLRKLSNGLYGLQELVAELSNQYGKSCSFKDDELFETIEELTYPEIRDFFELYVDGNNSLPLGQVFEHVGIDYSMHGTRTELSLGGISFSTNEDKNSVIITDTSDMNKFGKELGYMSGDVFYKFDGDRITAENFKLVFNNFKKGHTSGDKIEVIVFRKVNKSKQKKVKLTGTVMDTETKSKLKLEWNSNPTLEQLALRKSWINK